MNAQEVGRDHNNGGFFNVCFFRCPTSETSCHAKLSFGPMRPEISGLVHQLFIPRLPSCSQTLKRILERYTERKYGSRYVVRILDLEKTINLPSFNNEKCMLNFWFTFTLKPDQKSKHKLLQ